MRLKMCYGEIVNVGCTANENYFLKSGDNPLFFVEVMNMTKKWLKCAGIRAVKTIAQTAVAMIGTSVVISQVDWVAVVSASILAGILSLLTSVAGLPEVNEE